MTETIPVQIQTFADLLDSRQDLREILASNLNLAHACLLLRRGESEAVEKALELALRQADPTTAVIAECVRVELLRLAGDIPQALARAEALARSERFHPAAALYLRNLFPLMHAGHQHVPESIVPEAGPDTLAGSQDSSVSHNEVDSQVLEKKAESVHEANFPVAWAPIASDAAVVLLRLRNTDGIRENRSEEVAIGALEEIALTRTGLVLSRLGFGELRHAAFEGRDRTIHSWSTGDRTALLVMATGSSTSLLAARSTKAFRDPS